MPAIVDALQQYGLRLPGEFGGLCTTDVGAHGLHPLHDEGHGRRAYRVDDGSDFRRRPKAGFSVASLTVQAIEIGAMKNDRVGRGKKAWSAASRFFWRLEKWPQMPCLAHRRLLEWAVKVT